MFQKILIRPVSSSESQKILHDTSSAVRNTKSAMGNKSKIVKIETFVPEAYADKVREAMGKAGAGKIGKYSFCSFSVKGTGRFLPGKGAKPAVGKVGKLESVKEEKIEARCERSKLKEVIRAIRKAHPYEEAVIDVHFLEEI